MSYVKYIANKVDREKKQINKIAEELLKQGKIDLVLFKKEIMARRKRLAKKHPSIYREEITDRDLKGSLSAKLSGLKMEEEKASGVVISVKDFDAIKALGTLVA